VNDEQFNVDAPWSVFPRIFAILVCHRLRFSIPAIGQALYV